jgi:prevent-host-death family protein
MITFRNRQGELVDVPAIPATRLKNELGSLLDQAARGGAVAITRHDAPRAVLVSYEEFAALAKLRTPDLGDLDAEFDRLFEDMQKSGSRDAMAAAFAASPEQLGEAAVKQAARKHGAVKRAARR